MSYHVKMLDMKVECYSFFKLKERKINLFRRAKMQIFYNLNYYFHVRWLAEKSTSESLETVENYKM